MDFMKKRISILGATGSIGVQALEVIEKMADKFELIALAGGSNVELLEAQAKKFKPRYICRGEDELNRIVQDKENDMILVATSGKIGLKPTLTAIENGIDIALANKETLVMAGAIVMNAARARGVNILPVDSEHSAIFQCISGVPCGATADVTGLNKIIITASGGPFLKKSTEEIAKCTAEQALQHPKWNMGKKITIDSATLMNKGLEVIEAHHLFNLDYEKIDVVIHPQSIVHSAVEFVDGSVIAQLGLPSMHIPIQYALTYPNRQKGIKSNSFNFFDHNLTFEKPDFKKFPCLELAYEAGKIGGTMPTVLNAANEVAVEKFLIGAIKLTDIAKIVEEQMNAHEAIKAPTLDEIFEIDEFVRHQVALKVIQ